MQVNMSRLVVQHTHRHGLSGKEVRGSLREAYKTVSRKKTKESGSREVAWGLHRKARDRGLRSPPLTAANPSWKEEERLRLRGRAPARAGGDVWPTPGHPSLRQTHSALQTTEPLSRKITFQTNYTLTETFSSLNVRNRG